MNLNLLKVVGISILKGGKYVGLTAAGVAVAAASGVFEPVALAQLLGEVLSGPSAAVVIPFVAQALGGALGPVFLIAIQQIYKHRNLIKEG